MSPGLFIKAVAVWLGILVLAIGNGMLREAVLIPRLGQAPGLIVSGLVLAALIGLAAFVCVPWFGTRKGSVLLAIGVGWLALTLAFEFSFGLLRGMPLARILEAYTFKGGNLWPFVLLVTAIAPWLAGKLRGWL